MYVMIILTSYTGTEANVRGSSFEEPLSRGKSSVIHSSPNRSQCCQEFSGANLTADPFDPKNGQVSLSFLILFWELSFE
jgi:hypothetical protein